MENINTSPEYRAVSEKLHEIDTELAQIGRTREGILAEVRTKNTKTADPWESYVAGEEPSRPNYYAEELKDLAQREEFLVAAKKTGRRQLDQLRGSLSAVACQARRGEFVDQVRTILAGLQTIATANAKIAELRGEIEDLGYSHGSIPICRYDIGGSFSAYDEAHGSRPIFYRNEMLGLFPELKSPIAKLRAIAGK